MKATDGVVDRLNVILQSELTARDQYLLHAKMCRNWGYERLHASILQRYQDEVEDIQRLMSHILYLEGEPNIRGLGTETGLDVPSILAVDLKKEVDIVVLLREGIAHCAHHHDYTTRHLLENMITEEEQHVDWIETQLETITQIGLERYLAEQITAEGS